LDTVVSLISFAVMLFGVVDSLSADTDGMLMEKAVLAIIFVLMFTFTWFKSYSESLGVVKFDDNLWRAVISAIVNVMAFLWVPLTWATLLSAEAGLNNKTSGDVLANSEF